MLLFLRSSIAFDCIILDSHSCTAEHTAACLPANRYTSLTRWPCVALTLSFSRTDLFSSWSEGGKKCVPFLHCMTHVFQVIQDTIFETFIQKKLPHAFDYIINNGQVEFGLQELKLRSQFIPHNIHIQWDCISFSQSFLTILCSSHKIFIYLLSYFGLKAQDWNMFCQTLVLFLIGNCRHLAVRVRASESWQVAAATVSLCPL